MFRSAKIERIEPETARVKITFWFDGKYAVPADAKAVILSPRHRDRAHHPAHPRVYTGGPQMASGAVIPEQRTAVPVEWDELRQQLERLTHLLVPDQPGGLSTLGSVVHTTASDPAAVRARTSGTPSSNCHRRSRCSVTSQDLFGTVKNLSILVSALQDSGDPHATTQRQAGHGDRAVDQRPR